MGVKNVHVSVDSKLVANQVLGTYVAKEDNMVKHLDKVKGLVRGFINFSISQVPRSKNKKADALSKIALTSFAHLSKQAIVPYAVVKMRWTAPDGWIEAKAVATITGSQVKKSMAKCVSVVTVSCKWPKSMAAATWSLP
nr:reverse transcriptase domain-containing protein [Tanacetum cinerariifolium]